MCCAARGGCQGVSKIIIGGTKAQPSLAPAPQQPHRKVESEGLQEGAPPGSPG